MAKITKRVKKDGSCSYCIRVSNGYDRLGRQVLVNRTYTPPPLRDYFAEYLKRMLLTATLSAAGVLWVQRFPVSNFGIFILDGLLYTAVFAGGIGKQYSPPNSRAISGLNSIISPPVR